MYETVEDTSTEVPSPYFGANDDLFNEENDSREQVGVEVDDDEENFLVPGGLLDNALNNRDLTPNNNNIENEFIRNDRGPLPDPELADDDDDLIPDIAVDDLRKRIFLEGRQQPVKSSNEEDIVLEQNVLLGDQSVDPEQLAYILIGKKHKFESG